MRGNGFVAPWVPYEWLLKDKELALFVYRLRGLYDFTREDGSPFLNRTDRQGRLCWYMTYEQLQAHFNRSEKWVRARIKGLRACGFGDSTENKLKPGDRRGVLFHYLDVEKLDAALAAEVAKRATPSQGRSAPYRRAGQYRPPDGINTVPGVRPNEDKGSEGKPLSMVVAGKKPPAKADPNVEVKPVEGRMGDRKETDPLSSTVVEKNSADLTSGTRAKFLPKGYLSACEQWAEHSSKKLGKRERAQLKLAEEKYGAEVIERALKDWGAFAFKAKLEGGAPDAPSRPHVGFLAKYLHVAAPVAATARPQVAASRVPAACSSTSRPAPVPKAEQAPLELVRAALSLFKEVA